MDAAFESSPMLRMRTMTEIMNESGLAVAKIWPIRVWDHAPGGGAWVFPGLSNTEAIPTLWGVLHQIHDDWLREAGRFSYAGHRTADPELERTRFLFAALDELKPRYIQCLFSYINFFFVLENGFSVFYDELRALQHQLGLGLKTDKKPKDPAYFAKLRRVRNTTVVHWGGPEKKHDINSRAGRYWGFSFDGASDNLADLRFGSTSLVGADDRQLESIPETHRICTDHLKQYDALCAELFERVVSRLPITVGGKEYTHSKPVPQATAT
jgi:hypothetical protein